MKEKKIQLKCVCLASDFCPRLTIREFGDGQVELNMYAENHHVGAMVVEVAKLNKFLNEIS